MAICIALHSEMQFLYTKYTKQKEVQTDYAYSDM